jgi:hypothetical protein
MIKIQTQDCLVLQKRVFTRRRTDLFRTISTQAIGSASINIACNQESVKNTCIYELSHG